VIRFKRKLPAAYEISPEYERIRQAYLAQPDSEAEADDWSTVEEYKPRSV